MSNDLESLRKKIDDTDERITALFEERMKIASEIAEFKKQNGKPIYDPKREREKLSDIMERSSEEMKLYTPLLYSMIFELSRTYQRKIIGEQTELADIIMQAIEKTPKIFPEYAGVACQGIEGANSQTACGKLIPHANIMFFKTFDAVFTAIEKGLCRYGVIPIENSTAGSVNSVYDLMMHHNFHIVRSVRVKIDHNLLANPGVKLSDIKEVFSHEQAISQCSDFLSAHPEIKVTSCENTAVAAKLIAESGRRDAAALSSRECMRYYGLNCIKESIQNNEDNYTRFICITKELEIYPGANRSSLMVTLPHEPGSLFRLLSRFYALDINLIKLESRPLQGRDFEFMFYFDIETPVYSPRFIQLINELPAACDRFVYLGSYNEVI